MDSFHVPVDQAPVDQVVGGRGGKKHEIYAAMTYFYRTGWGVEVKAVLVPLDPL